MMRDFDTDRVRVMLHPKPEERRKLRAFRKWQMQERERLAALMYSLIERGRPEHGRDYENLPLKEWGKGGK